MAPGRGGKKTQIRNAKKTQPCADLSQQTRPAGAAMSQINVSSLIQLGNAKFAAGAHREAADAYTAALAEDPTNLRGLGNRAQAFLSLRRWEEAATGHRRLSSERLSK